MKASHTRVFLGLAHASADDCFPDGTSSSFVWAHFKGNAKQRRIARRSYIRFAKATCAARGIPLYINGILQ